MSADAPRTIAALAQALRARELTAETVTEQCLHHIAERDGSVNAFITVLGDEARARARELDHHASSGHWQGPLHGVPIAIKDLIDVRGTVTTAASRLRRDARPAETDAPLVIALRDAGAILIGKTNLHEFALGTTSEESAFGPVRHPLDPNRSPGGSSGGSAAAVLAQMAYGAIGSDTGGSIRIPAAACGIVGLKPATGEISTRGVIPLSTTMDTVGPLCRTVEDAAIVYQALLGSARPVLQPLPAAGLRIGVLRGYFTALLEPQVAHGFEEAVRRCADAGATLDEVSIPHAGDIAPVYLHILLSEAAAYHARSLESRPDDYAPNVRLRFEMGRYILAEDYVRALRGRDVLREEVNAALAGRHALLLPSLPLPAPRIGVTSVKFGSSEEPLRNLMLRLTQLFNLTGHPAIAVPCGKTIEGLPVSAQLVGPENNTANLLAAAMALEPHLTPARFDGHAIPTQPPSVDRPSA